MGNSCSGAGACCRGEELDQLSSYAAIVEHYRRNYLPLVEREIAFYRRATSPEAAIVRAFRCRKADGGLHEHQHRVGCGRVDAAAALVRPHVNAIMQTSDFRELHALVTLLARDMQRIGELAVYDVAQRIGWYRRLEPIEIYLHRGTLDGARALTPLLRGKTITADLLPVALRAFTPAQLEDVLCIYKAALQRIAPSA